uniref:Uncharacterized protein n=1 Tax=Steinernema glaseri TaxID=37863 RepID=A0A1I7Z4Q5_9BILA
MRPARNTTTWAPLSTNYVAQSSFHVKKSVVAFRQSFSALVAEMINMRNKERTECNLWRAVNQKLVDAQMCRFHIPGDVLERFLFFASTL